ncbi:MAG TPA: hypothetical protein VMY37_32510 [Thermoguttaceae bacterium]|nr:hypothetical protein [Thermoguttaceae bacterium]
MTTWTTIIVSVLAMSALPTVATTAKNEAQNPSEGLLISDKHRKTTRVRSDQPRRNSFFLP